MYVHLEQAGLVQGRVEQREEALVRNVWPRVGNVAARLGEDALVVVAVEQRVLGVFRAGPAARSRGRLGRGELVRFEACLFVSMVFGFTVCQYLSGGWGGVHCRRAARATASPQGLPIYNEAAQ